MATCGRGCSPSFQDRKSAGSASPRLQPYPPSCFCGIWSRPSPVLSALPSLCRRCPALQVPRGLGLPPSRRVVLASTCSWSRPPRPPTRPFPGLWGLLCPPPKLPGHKLLGDLVREHTCLHSLCSPQLLGLALRRPGLSFHPPSQAAQGRFTRPVPGAPVCISSPHLSSGRQSWPSHRHLCEVLPRKAALVPLQSPLPGQTGN